ncbi:DUF2779 domain-containing protein [Candidatus Dojkabacteria bacterium]|nr:DUF2779 domain-containing protein [Candidatus Dojkabacteria bacterium]
MLNKTEFKLFLNAPLHLWAKKHNEYTENNNDFIEHIKEQGIDAEKYALQYVKNYISSEYEYQRTFEYNDLECRTDILIKNLDRPGYSLYEIKSTTDVKQVHEYDIIFQYYIASQTIEITNLYVIHVNKDYVREGELDLHKAYKVRDVTSLIVQKLTETTELIEKAKQTILEDNISTIEPCHKPKECPCPHLCFPALPQYSIYNLANVNESKLGDLRSLGILDLNDIPDGFSLSGKQRYQLISTKTLKPLIDYERLQSFIKDLTFPLYFLDYEAYSWAIPLYDRHTTYQNVVFQFSLHKLTSERIALEHYEFISTSKEDPMKEVVHELKSYIGEEGTILVWNKIFEQGCNSEMARIYPEFKEYLLGLNKRIVDLADIFNKQIYVDYRFKGSWSLKNVLPVIVPSLDYKELPISNGTSAMRNWKTLISNTVTLKEKNQIKDQLLEYCELDTFSMFKILERMFITVGKTLI